MVKQYQLKAGDDGNWRVQRKDSDRALRIMERKNDARSYAKEVAQNQNGKLKVYTKSGKVQSEFDYTD